MEHDFLKEKIPYGNNFFPLKIHEFETDIKNDIIR